MKKETVDKFIYERKWAEKGYTLIAGVDEVGRGPLAGPVVCGAVIMPLNDVIEGIDDSKKLSAKKREELDKLIREKAVAYSIAQIESDEIDEINILNAVKKCMKAAVDGLNPKPEVVLIDALNIEIGIPVEPIIKGDYLSYTIGCASIIAKVYRDKLMEKYADEYPEYCFEKHKGYGTEQHIAKIKEIGPCKIHRRSFIKNFWGKTEKDEPNAI